MKKLKIGVDVDDILYECSSFAISLANKKYGMSLKTEDLSQWGPTGKVTDVIFEWFEDPWFFEHQPLIKGAQSFIKKLSEIAEVFFVSAISIPCMTTRGERLMKDFPMVKPQNIILGHRKDIVSNLDILLDDGAHNITESSVAYPVLFRRPWNSHLTGLLAVNDYDEFLQVVRQIMSPSPKKGEKDIVCLVGPSGSGKTAIKNELEKTGEFKKPVSSTTRVPRPGESLREYDFITAEQFLAKKKRGEFLEFTIYAGNCYGTTFSSINDVLHEGKTPIIPIDIAGALALKNHFDNVAIIFINRDKKAVISEIIKRDVPNEEKVNRLISLNDEYKNEQVCDYSVLNDSSIKEVSEKIIKIKEGRH